MCKPFPLSFINGLGKNDGRKLLLITATVSTIFLKIKIISSIKSITVFKIYLI